MKSKDNLYSVLGGAIILVVIVAFFVMDGNHTQQIIVDNTPSDTTSSDTTTSGTSSTSVVPKVIEDVFSISEDDPIYGRRDATVFVVEYSDFECPFCKRFHPTAKDVVDESNGKVAWIYRHNALPSHPNADEAAIISECVFTHKGNESFWRFSDEIFEDQSRLSTRQLKTLSSRYGLSDGEVSTCLRKDSAQSRKVETQITQARKLGFNGTPNGVIFNIETSEFAQLTGAIEKETLEALIKSLE